MSSQSDKVLTQNPQDRMKEEIETEIKVKQQQLSGMRRRSFIMSEMAKSQDPEESEFEDQIQTYLHQKDERERIKNLAKKRNLMDPNFWKYFLSKNVEFISITVMELNLLLLTYPLLTLKTRMQARNPQEDVAYFIKNGVKEKSLYQGIGQGLFSVFFGNTISINIYKYMQNMLKQTPHSYSRSPFKHFRDNLIAHTVGDIASLPCRVFFDAKKQFLQMNHTTYDFWQVMKASKLGFVPILIRDMIFRTLFNCINHFMLYTKYYYYSWKNPNIIDIYIYEGKINSNQKVGSMLLSTLIAVILSNPLDVVAVKLMTQQYEKYTGMMDCFRTVLKEETNKKLWFSGFGARTAFFAFNGYAVLNYYPSFKNLVEEAYAIV